VAKYIEVTAVCPKDKIDDTNSSITSTRLLYQCYDKMARGEVIVYNENKTLTCDEKIKPVQNL
jgi:hypothetical protein